MAKVMIGGTEYETGPLKFKQLKKVWPVIQQNQDLAKAAKEADSDIDPMVAMGNAILIVAAALERTHPEMTAEKIEEEIDATECVSLQTVILDIIQESGFTIKGEDLRGAGAAASPSTETLTE